jgi:pilus assembly protein CpaC
LEKLMHNKAQTRRQGTAKVLVRYCTGLVLLTGLLWADSSLANDLLPAQDPKVLSLGQGNEKVWQLPVAPIRVAIGNPAIAALNLVSGTGGKEYLLTGKQAGETSLLAWLPGHRYPQVWQVMVNLPTTKAPLAAPAPGMPTVQSQGPVVTLSGAVSSVMQEEDALQAAQAVAGKGATVLNETTIPVDNEVQIGVKVVEFSKSQLQNIGINFFAKTSNFTLGTFAPPVSATTATPLFQAASSAANATLIGQAFSVLGGSSNGNFLGYLNLLQANNVLRILAEPTLVAMNGHKASFLAGGQIPIPVPQSSGGTSPTITIQYKNYGVALDVTPYILSKNQIALHIAPSVSALDYTNAVTINGYSVPALTVRRANTTVTLGNGESLVIGGLVDRQMQQNINKVPLLGDLPILGAFFRSIQYSTSNMELAIIVTPRLVRPIAANAKLPALPGSTFADTPHHPLKELFLPGSEDGSAGPGYEP